MTGPDRKPLFDAAKALGARFNDGADVKAFDRAIDALLDAAMAPIVVTADRPSVGGDGAGHEDVPHFDVIKAHLEREEGRVPWAYKDNLGYLTIGVGRLIDRARGGRVSDDEIDMLLANDVKNKMAEIEDWPAWQAVKDDPVRATALLSMAFQMGSGKDGLGGFVNSLRLIAQKQWTAAARNLIQSKWAHQTPERAQRVTQMIATGVMQS